MKDNGPESSDLYNLHPRFHYIFLFMFFLGLLSPSRSTRVVIFIAILVSSTYVLLYTSVPKDANVSFLAIVQTILRASDALIINDINSFRRIGQRQDTNQLGLSERMNWAFSYVCSYRLVGWNHEPRHVLPPRPTESRWQFITNRIVMSIWYTAIFDVAQTIIRYIPRDGWHGTSISAITLRLLSTAAYAVVCWYMLGIIYALISIIAVGAGISEASEWPAFFGKWSDAYTVRRFWGRTWHQNLRRIVSVHGDLVAYQILGLQRDTFVGINVHRFVAFSVSGAIHVAADYAPLRSKIWKEQTSMTFFLLQPIAIMFEQEIGMLFGVRPGRWAKRVGYVWTFLWFAMTFLPWIEFQLRTGPGELLGIWKYGSATNMLLTGHWRY